MSHPIFTEQTADYRIDVDVFQGPLDLLLYLIDKEEIDIYDIPIAKITRQYLNYIEMMTSLNLEVAGEFILMAASLIRIKTRMLLPRDEENPEEIDPREELVLALIEYRKFKEAGQILREKALSEELNYVPPSPIARPETRVEVKSFSTLFDLISAFKEVTTRIKSETFHDVVAEEVSIHDRMTIIVTYLRDRDMATFEELFADTPRKIIAVVTFIALLEMVRTRRVALFQSFPFTQIRVCRGERFEAPIESDAEDEITALVTNTEE